MTHFGQFLLGQVARLTRAVCKHNNWTPVCSKALLLKVVDGDILVATRKYSRPELQDFELTVLDRELPLSAR